jgi:hypothetical protein
MIGNIEAGRDGIRFIKIPGHAYPNGRLQGQKTN